MIRSMRRLALTALLALPLAACGTNPEQVTNFTILKSMGASLIAPIAGAPPPQQAAASPEQINAVLNQIASDRGVIRLSLLSTGDSAIGISTGSNRGMRTYGTVTGQSLTFRNGVLVATRGFGYDLMSSALNNANRLVTSRSSGQVQRIYRFLDGENQERDFPVTCSIASEGGETIRVSSGARFSTTRMRETCQTGPFTFNNFYWVTGGGTVKKSHQWISREVGEVRIEVLRD